MKVWIDGTTVDGSQASISVLDHGLLYGDGIFEGIRALGGYVLDLELHSNAWYDRRAESECSSVSGSSSCQRSCSTRCLRRETPTGKRAWW